MKTIMKWLLMVSILAISELIFTTRAHSQTCSPGKVWACRSTCVNLGGGNSVSWYECKCVNESNVAQWQANGHGCNPNGGGNGNGGYMGRVDDEGSEQPLSIYPNPVKGTSTISFDLKSSQFVFVGLYDVAGKLMTVLNKSDREAGQNELLWNAENFTPGIYLLNFRTEEESFTEKIIIQ